MGRGILPWRSVISGWIKVDGRHEAGLCSLHHGRKGKGFSRTRRHLTPRVVELTVEIYTTREN